MLIDAHTSILSWCSVFIFCPLAAHRQAGGHLPLSLWEIFLTCTEQQSINHQLSTQKLSFCSFSCICLCLVFRVWSCRLFTGSGWFQNSVLNSESSAQINSVLSVWKCVIINNINNKKCLFLCCFYAFCSNILGATKAKNHKQAVL